MHRERAESALVRSVNVGHREDNPAKDGTDGTGIGKRAVASAELRAPGPKRGGLGSGLVGDHIGDTASHGGDRQAVYAFAREELDCWEQRLGQQLPDGLFGENLTTTGFDVDAARPGDRWAVGDDVVLEVTGPRVPCATFAHVMAAYVEKGWLRTFTEVGRTGAYLSIVTGGEVRPGDPVRVVARARHRVGLPEAFRAFMGDLDAADRVLVAGFLPEDEAEWLRGRVAARAAASQHRVARFRDGR
jgi:MOSC domain-containing protein YiiM